MRGVAAAHGLLKDYISAAQHTFSYIAHSAAANSTFIVQEVEDIERNKDVDMANYIHVPEEAPAVPKIDVTVDESDYRSGALKLIKELRPSWKPSEVKLKVQFM